MKMISISRPRKRAPETALYDLRGSLLPENGADAKPFLSDVYNKGTRAKKRLAGVSLYDLRSLLPQNATDTTLPDDDVYNLGTRRGRTLVDGALSGRSMVEMLGVLAIIGVLSVGAIAGYKKAMEKHTWNKFSQGLTLLNYAGTETCGKIKDDRLNINYTFHNMLPLSSGFTIRTNGPHPMLQFLPSIGFTYSWYYCIKGALQIEFYGTEKDFCEKILAYDWFSIGAKQVNILYGQSFKEKPTLNEISNACQNVSDARIEFRFY